MHTHRSRTGSRGVAVVLLLTLSVALMSEVPQVLGAEPDQIMLQGLRPAQVVEVAEHLLLAGRNDEARALLEQLERDGEGGSQREFLQGLLAMANGDHVMAERHFRAMLDRDPTLTRVRLELARALYLQGEDEAADYHFRLALARKPPPGVVQTVNRFREVIRGRRAWRFDFGIGVAPDTNVNGATSKERVTLFGLPFELDDEGRSHSGIGLALNFDASYRLRRDASIPFYLGAYGRSLRYNHDAFNDEYIGMEAGPEFRTRLGRLRTTVTGFTRWYGGAAYQHSTGARAALESPVSARWALSSAIDIRTLDHPDRRYLDGHEYNLSFAASRVLGPGTLATAWTGYRCSSARDAGYASRGGRVGAGLSHELGWATRLGLGIELSRTIYDEPIAIFGAKRKDWGYFLSTSLMKRDWNFAGFAPSLRISYAVNDSPISIYASKRWRAEIGINRAF